MLTKYDDFLLENFIEDDFRFWVDDITGWLPRSVSGFSRDYMTIRFSEEVKDGRSPKFSEYDIQKLKGKTFKHENTIITIKDVELSDTDTDPYDYSTYYYYTFKLTK